MIEEARFCDALRNAKCGMQNSENVLGLMLWENAEKGIGEILCLSKGLTTPDGLQPAISAFCIPHSAFPARVVLFIGPEGGFSHEEADEATRMGIIPVSLGNQILRTETAGIVGLTVVAYEMGLLGGQVF